MKTPSILHHFTSAQHLSLIKQTGAISKGLIPNRLLPNGKVSFARGYQWLTADPDWAAQSWADPMLSPLPYRKNEYRLTVEFPNFALGKLIHWEEFSRRVRPDSAPFLDSFRGHRHWWLYQGFIPCMWFVEETKNPTPIFLPHLDSHSSQ